MKNICKKVFDPKILKKVINQLKKNPELCEICKIKPCSLAIYIAKIKSISKIGREND